MDISPDKIMELLQLAAQLTDITVRNAEATKQNVNVSATFSHYIAVLRNEYKAFTK